MRRRTRTSNWQPASKTPTSLCTPCTQCIPKPPGPDNDFSSTIRRPMEGSNALLSQGPAPDRTYISAGHADVDGYSPVFAGRLRHGRASDSDPASGWASNPPGEGVSVTDPAPGWTNHSSRRQLGYLPTSHMTPTSAWWNDLPARPSPPRRGLICRRDRRP